MKNIKQVLAAFLVFFSVASFAGEKKVKSFLVYRDFNVPAQTIWKIVGEDYGSVAYSHPRIIESDYISGSLKAEEGAERVCYFDEEHKQFLKEKMINYDPGNMTFINKVYQAGKFPVDPDYTQAVYKVEDLGEGKSRLSFDMQFRTTPAFMGALMKGNFKSLIQDYFIAIEHHAVTGEKVTRSNFKTIKKQYKK